MTYNDCECSEEFCRYNGKVQICKVTVLGLDSPLTTHNTFFCLLCMLITIDAILANSTNNSSYIQFSEKL